MDRDTAIGGPGRSFPATRLSVVEALRSPDAASRRQAAERVIGLYWKPLYSYLRVRFRPTNEDAKDLIQGFFALALERETLASFDPSQASFRTFLRLLLDRYASNEHKSRSRQKRGGDWVALDFDQAEADLARLSADGADPEHLLQREWTRALFAAGVERLEAELRDSGRAQQFEIFAAFDLEDGPERPTYREIASRLGIAETKVTNDLAAARRRLRRIVLATLREVTASPAEYEAEARALGIAL